MLQDLLTIGYSEDTTEKEKERQRVLILMALLMSAGALVWGAISLANGLTTLSAIPFGYIVLTVANFFVFHLTHDFKSARFLQTAMSVSLPFLFQWLLGGFIPSGIVCLWALVPIIVSLTFYGLGMSIGWMVAYIALLLVNGWESVYQPPEAVVKLASLQRVFLLVNLSCISAAVFCLVAFFKQRREQMHRSLLDSYQDLQLSEAEIKQNLEELSNMHAQVVAAKDRLQRTFDMERKARESLEQKDMELYRTMKELEKKEEKNRDQAKKLHQANASLEQQFLLIKSQNETIERWNEALTQNIRYARRIQLALMGSEKRLQKHLPYSFVLEHPKDLVGGDFYWISQIDDDLLVLAVVDCTGHGVSGALMSIVGISLLNDIVNARGYLNPSIILEQLNKSLKMVMGEYVDGKQINDGMDAGIITIDYRNRSIQYAGAHTPLYLLRKKEVITYKGSKCPVGGFHRPNRERVYEEHTISIQPEDRIFLGSDGLQDQFGGTENRKLLSKNLKRWLIDLAPQSIFLHKQELATRLMEWRGEEKQTDDIIFLGIEFNYELLKKT